MHVCVRACVCIAVNRIELRRTLDLEPHRPEGEQKLRWLETKYLLCTKSRKQSTCKGAMCPASVGIPVQCTFIVDSFWYGDTLLRHFTKCLLLGHSLSFACQYGLVTTKQ